MISLEEKYRDLQIHTQQLVDNTQTKLQRYLLPQIDWSNQLIGIYGARGVGKTTLLLQHIKLTFPKLQGVLYVSLDDIWFTNNAVQDMVQYHYNHGGTHIFFDEIHYLQHWQTIIKNMYDYYPTMHIVFTGSSMLKMKVSEGDLSRRLIKYTLNGLSFREYLCFEGFDCKNVYSIDEILHNTHDAIQPILQQMKVLPPFEQYLKQGYYPYYKKDKSGYADRVLNTINEVLDVDMPAIDDVSFSTVVKTKRMLVMLSKCVPQTPRMSELYSALETNREQGLKMLYALERAGILSLLTYEPKSLRNIAKPDKFYLNNTNLMYCLAKNVNIGTVRETFFYNQLQVNHETHLPKQGDFIIDEKYTFEVGGKDKDFSQIKDLPDSYLAIDDTEYGFRNRIPLWLFGFLY